MRRMKGVPTSMSTGCAEVSETAGLVCLGAAPVAGWGASKDQLESWPSTATSTPSVRPLPCWDSCATEFEHLAHHRRETRIVGRVQQTMAQGLGVHPRLDEVDDGRAVGAVDRDRLGRHDPHARSR